MNVLKKLDEVRCGKPYHGFGKLAVGFYQIECFRMVKNKFVKKGETNKKSILIELADQILFLPQYFSQKLKESDINELNDSDDEIYLHFGGQLVGTK